MTRQFGSNKMSLAIAASLLLSLSFTAWAQDTTDTNANTEPGISTTAPAPTINNSMKEGQTGVGLQTGSLTGVNIQRWIENDRNITGAIAYERGNTAVSLSHIWTFQRMTAQGSLIRDFVPYVGAGAIASFGTKSDYFSRTSANENMAIAAQVPIGIDYLPRLERFDIFAELAPAFEITPLQAGVFTANLGARYFF